MTTQARRAVEASPREAGRASTAAPWGQDYRGATVPLLPHPHWALCPAPINPVLSLNQVLLPLLSDIKNTLNCHPTHSPHYSRGTRTHGVKFPPGPVPTIQLPPQGNSGARVLRPSKDRTVTEGQAPRRIHTASCHSNRRTQIKHASLPLTLTETTPHRSRVKTRQGSL